MPDASVLVLTGSPIAHRLTFPRRVEYIKLPSVRKRGPEEYVSRELSIPFWRLRRMRLQIIRDTLRLFRPHILFVDNVPLGMKGEILPALQEIKSSGAAIHLNLRDILDDSGAVREQWVSDGTLDALHSLYDEIHVFGDPSVHDAAEEYGLPAWKTSFHGYIAPPRPESRERLLPLRRRNGAPSVLLTIGGGEDGIEILRCALEAERRFEDLQRLDIDLVLGPLLDPEEADQIKAEARNRNHVSVCDFVEDLAEYMPEYDLVISMGGYNTLCEVMSGARRSLVIPRVHPRREQEIRARALESRGIVRWIHPRDLTPERFASSVVHALERDSELPYANAPCLEGIGNFKRRMETIARSLREPLPRGGGRDATIGSAARRRSRARSEIFGLALLVLLFGPATDAGASLRPNAVNAEVLVGYDTNILDASNAEIHAFETHDPGSFFVVRHMNDGALQMSVDGRWPLAVDGGKTEARLRYTRLQYLRETIRSESHYSLLWRTRSDPRTEIEMSLEFAPNIYGRHRRDKDAIPGDPVFRAEVRDEWDTALQVTRSLHPGWSSVTVLEGSVRDYRPAFDERDRWRAGGRTGLLWQTPGGAVTFNLTGGYRRLRSRNVPYVGSDLSYRDWTVRSAAELVCLNGFLRLRAYANRDWLDYTSSDPSDQSHYGRRDGAWEVGGLARHAFSPSFDWSASIAHLRRDTMAGAVMSGDLDEEGSIRDTFVTTGVAWHWKP
ncbi:MAG TPA: glycosyltransferase [Candidatus Binatia bacterium]|nr:glycosyltransferase [Candidatus Binatia bacterium]